MAKTTRIVCYAAVAIGVFASHSKAGVYFTPGDAFFHAAATREELAKVVKLQEEGFATIRYSPPESAPASLGADLGFDRLRSVSGDKHMWDKITSAVSNVTMENEDPESAVVDIFIYNKSFEYKKYRIGLKYNEAWVDPVQNEIFPRGDRPTIVSANVYSPFARAKKMVIEDWLDAARVDGLAVSVPKDVVWRRFGRRLEEVVEIDLDKCMILFVGRNDLQGVIERRNNAMFLRLMDGEIVRFRWREGSWANTD